MNLKKEIEKAFISASTSYPKDRIAAFKRALAIEEEEKDEEKNENSIWALKLMIKNAEIANSNKLPLCDDTGIPHVFIEVPKDVKIPNTLFSEIKEGIANGLKSLPGRPMAVKGNEKERIEQSKGLYDDPEMVVPPSFLIDTYTNYNNYYYNYNYHNNNNNNNNNNNCNNYNNYNNYDHHCNKDKDKNNDKIKVHLLLLGGGPEIRAKTYRIFHKRSYNEVMNIAIDRLKETLNSLGCTPSIPAIGIGRTHFEANSSLIKAMVYGNLNKQSDTENYITAELNKTNIGPMGLGGKTTVLGSFLNVAPQRASGVRIVATRPCCFVEPRIATVEIS